MGFKPRTQPLDEELVARVRGALAERDDVSERRMFGGVAFMVGGHMAIGSMPGRLMVRVGPEAFEDALARPGARVMDFTGRPMHGFVWVDAAVLTEASLREWVAAGVAYASTKPPRRAPRAP